MLWKLKRTTGSAETSFTLCFLFGPQSRRPGDGYSPSRLTRFIPGENQLNEQTVSVVEKRRFQRLWQTAAGLKSDGSAGRDTEPKQFLSVFKAVRGHLMKHSLPNMRVLLHTLFVGVWWQRWGWGGGPLPRGSLLRSRLNLCWFHGLKKPTKGVDVEVVNACLICLMLNQKKKFCATVDPTCLLRIVRSSVPRKRSRSAECGFVRFLIPCGRNTRRIYI